MAKYQVTAQDGYNYEVEAPDNATDQEVLSYVQEQIASPAEESAAPSRYESLGRGAAQGATFNNADEITGGIAAFKDAVQKGNFDTLLNDYKRRRNNSRENYHEAQAENPGTYLAGEVAGTVAPLLIPGVGEALAPAKGAGLLARLGTNAAVGAGMGAAQAAGASENDLGTSGFAKDVLAGGAMGTAGGAVGGELTNLAGKAIDALPTPSMKELVAESTAGMLGGTGRQLGRLGKNPTDVLEVMGRDLKDMTVDGQPLMLVKDQFGERLERFIKKQKEIGQVIGDTIDNANVAPLTKDQIAAELPKLMDPTSKQAIQSIIDDIGTYADGNGNISFKALQDFKQALGEEAFPKSGMSNNALVEAYYKISDMQERLLDSVNLDVPAFMKAKQEYKTIARSIPMLKLAVGRELAGATKQGSLMPATLAAATGNIVPAIGLAGAAVAKPFLSPLVGNLEHVPQNLMYKAVTSNAAGVLANSNVGATGAIIGANMPEYKHIFEQAAAGAKNQGERDKSYAVTDYTLSQRDPNYSKRKQELADAQ